MKGVYFDGKHSYIDFGLITSHISIGTPQPKTNYIDIPGGDGALDLTEATGPVRFNDRTLDFLFTMQGINEDRKTLISNYLHGQKRKIILDKDPDYYYFGRCTVDSFSSDGTMSQLKVTAQCDPYKYHHTESMHKELIAGQKNIIVINDQKTVIPVIETDAELRLTSNGKTYLLAVGRHKYLDIQLYAGYNRFSITGTGTIIFRYQEGAI